MFDRNTYQWSRNQINKRSALYLEIYSCQGKKYVKRSELERVSTGDDPEQDAVTSPIPTASILRSPTSLTPVEDSPIFSIPKSEVYMEWR